MRGTARTARQRFAVVNGATLSSRKTTPNAAPTRATFLRTTKMQCKDIPDRPVLEFLRKLDGVGATWFDYEPRPPNTVLRAMPTGTPEKLALAKMRMLMRRGLAGYRVCTGLRVSLLFALFVKLHADVKIALA